MNFNLNEWLKETIEGETIGESYYQKVRPRILCNDGYSVSVQASEFTYCTPRTTQWQDEDGTWHVINGDFFGVLGGALRRSTADEYTPYETVELGYPSEEDELINEYAEDDEYTHTVYGYVPVGIVEQLIEKHGGYKGFDMSNVNRGLESLPVISEEDAENA